MILDIGGADLVRSADIDDPDSHLHASANATESATERLLTISKNDFQLIAVEGGCKSYRQNRRVPLRQAIHDRAVAREMLARRGWRLATLADNGAHTADGYNPQRFAIQSAQPQPTSRRRRQRVDAYGHSRFFDPARGARDSGGTLRTCEGSARNTDVAARIRPEMVRARGGVRTSGDSVGRTRSAAHNRSDSRA